MHDAPMRERDLQREWIAGGDRADPGRRDQLVGVDEVHVGASARGALQADVKVHDLKLVLDEGAAGQAVLAAPFNIGKLDAVALDQEAGASVGERVHEVRRASEGEAVELGMWPIKVARMEQPGEAVIGAIKRAADQGRDVGRSQKAMPRELADDQHVVVGNAEGGRLRRAPEAGATGRRGRR